MTGDIAPVMVGVAPTMMARRRAVVNKPASTKPKLKRKTAVECILGESEDKSLIPPDAEDLLSPADVQAKEDAAIESEPAGGEALLQPSLALVAPDTTPNAVRELDPSLVPDRDPALSTILGDTPTPGPAAPVNPGPVSKTDPSVDSMIGPPSTESKVVKGESRPLNESQPLNEMGLPSTEMPRPPGDFLPSIGDLTGETKDVPRVELVIGSSSNPIQASVTEGQLGAAAMPTPREANTDKTLAAFRRFHRVKASQ